MDLNPFSNIFLKTAGLLINDIMTTCLITDLQKINKLFLIFKAISYNLKAL